MVETSGDIGSCSNVSNTAGKMFTEEYKIQRSRHNDKFKEFFFNYKCRSLSNCGINKQNFCR